MMNLNKRPHPLFLSENATTRKCPVCGFASYSRDGIHPQCARQRADERRIEKLKSRQGRETAEPSKAKSPSSLALKPWHKRCPKCGIQVHVRRSNCHCGYGFSRDNTIGSD